MADKEFKTIDEQIAILRSRGLTIHDADGTIDNAHLYGFILIMRRLLTLHDFSSLKDSLPEISKDHPFVDLRYYGFRNDWKIVL